jgi:NADPH:quinone reductase-like Zn-dependent oxidoreductase
VRALVIPRHGGPDVLEVQERPDPEPGPGQVRVRVRAAGINYADLLARAGLYRDAPDVPCVVGYEIAGEVESLGDGVDSWSVGDRVMGGSRFNGQAELVATGAENLVPLPDDWSFEEGAALPVNYATAYAAVVRYGSLCEGERVLVQAAAGGVGIAITQIARLAGAGEVFGTASPGKHDRIRELGVDHPIDYRSDDVVKAVRRIAGRDEPLDLACDAIGGRSFKQSWSLVRPGGRLVLYGAASVMSGESSSRLNALKTLAGMPIFHPVGLMSNSKSVIGLNMLKLWDEHGSLEEWVEPLRRWVDEGSLRPVVAEPFLLERAADAHRFIHERRNVGKVVLTL